MKALVFSLLLVLASSRIFAQESIDAAASKAPVPPASKETPNLAVTEGKQLPPLKPALSYRGFFVELKRSDDKASFLSLRKPSDPRRDLENIYLDERTNRPKGFVLFALDF